jgi:Domain of unknown function (DUF397)
VQAARRSTDENRRLYPLNGPGILQGERTPRSSPGLCTRIGLARIVSSSSKPDSNGSVTCCTRAARTSPQCLTRGAPTSGGRACRHGGADEAHAVLERLALPAVTAMTRFLRSSVSVRRDGSRLVGICYWCLAPARQAAKCVSTRDGYLTMSPSAQGPSAWRRSSKCAATECVEIAREQGMILLRDSKSTGGLTNAGVAVGTS